MPRALLAFPSLSALLGDAKRVRLTARGGGRRALRAVPTPHPCGAALGAPGAVLSRGCAVLNRGCGGAKTRPFTQHAGPARGGGQHAAPLCLALGHVRYDLYSAYGYTIPPMEKALGKTDIQIALPSGYYGRVAPRSGLAAKHVVDVGAGVTNEDYRGNIGVVVFNFGKEKFEVK